jgi:AraC-like DNA-binding protein
MDSRTGTTLLRAQDAEAAEQLGSAHFYPQRVVPLDTTSPFDWVFSLSQLGPMCIGDCAYGSDVRLVLGELGSYHVTIPLTGSLVTTQRGATVTATPSAAAVYQPVGATVLDRWAGNCRVVGVKIDTAALEATLAASLGRDITTPIDFGPSLDIGTGPGRGWAELVSAVNAQIHRGGGILDQPLVAAPLANALLSGLLAAADHPFRAALAEPPPGCRPPVIRRAIEFMHEHADEPITINEIARHCSVSVRTLQEGFHRHVGQPPLRQLRQIRLAKARASLKTANPHQDTVLSIAHRWGFTHLGRFASDYQAAFGELPSVSLRGGKPATNTPPDSPTAESGT